MSSPLACKLEALDANQRERHATLFKKISGSVVETKELPDGYGFRFQSKEPMFLSISEWITLESLCCPFLTFNLNLESSGEIWLELTGPKGVKQLLTAELGPNNTIVRGPSLVYLTP